jgi:protein-disulfide isomerase
VPLLEQVLEKNPNKVKVAFKNFPIRRHEFSATAAMAALVAQNYGKFWEFHDLLFENYSLLSDEKIREIALKVGIDEEKFEEGLRNPQLVAKIRRDIQDGHYAGVNGTPTVFVNGRLLRKRTLERFQKLIDKALDKLEKDKP